MWRLWRLYGPMENLAVVGILFAVVLVGVGNKHREEVLILSHSLRWLVIGLFGWQRSWDQDGLEGESFHTTPSHVHVQGLAKTFSQQPMSSNETSQGS